VSGSAAAGLGGAGLDAFFGEPRRVELNRRAVQIASLPPGLDGFRIVQLSDLHFHDGVHPAARRAAALIAAASPDLTIVTGDLAESTGQLPEVESFLREVRGRVATLVTIGNWERAVGITPTLLRRACSAAGARLLLNEAHVEVAGAGSLAVAGLDDPLRGEPDPRAALRDVPAHAVQVWAFHAPGYADRLQGGRIAPPAFMLAGHTHGGQIRPPLLPAVTPPGSGRFLAGWYLDSFAPLYVNRGVGTTTIRARFRCPPEVAVFTLVRG